MMHAACWVPWRRSERLAAGLLAGLALIAMTGCGPSQSATGPNTPALGKTPIVETQPSASALFPATAAPQVASATFTPPSGPIGTPHTMTLQAVAPDGRWVVACQAREDTNKDGKVWVGLGYHGDVVGDFMRPYLIVGDGPGKPVGEFIASDGTGRYLATIEDGKLHLYDTHTGQETTLDEPPLRDPNPFGPPPAASFDDKGKRMSFVRDGKVVVKELATGAEHIIDPGPGLLWRQTLDGSGQYVRIDVVPKDSDGDGKLSLPRANTSLSGRHCRGPIAIYGVYGWSGDKPVTKMARVGRDAMARERNKVLGVSGDALVWRRADGALMADTASAEVTIADAACKGIVVDSQQGRLLFMCEAKSKRGADEVLVGELYAYSAGKTRALGVRVLLNERDSLEPHSMLHMEDGKILVLPHGKVVNVSAGLAAAFGDKLLLVDEDNAAAIMDIKTEKRTPLGVSLTSPVHQSGAVVAAQMSDGKVAVIDLARGVLRGTVQGTVMAVSESGHVLLRKSETRQGLAEGPLFWQAPPAKS